MTKGVEERMDSEVSAMSRAIDLGNLSTHGPDEENLFVPVDEMCIRDRYIPLHTHPSG